MSAFDAPSSVAPTSGAVLLIGHVLHPVDNLAVERFLNGDMNHRGRRCGAVPVFLAGRKPHHVARSDFFDRAAPALNPPQAGYDDQSLAERMRVPRSSRAWLESDAGAAPVRRLRGFE